MVLLGLLSQCAIAQQPVLPNNIAARSVSGQFLVYKAALDAPNSIPRQVIADTSLVELEPTLLVVSSERLKQAVQQELSASDEWRGRIKLALHPVRTLSDPVTVYCEQFPNTWAYRVELPQFVERRRFVQVLVQTLLLEQANRRAHQRSAEIPTWLVEGLSEHLLNSREMEVILPPPRSKMGGLVVAYATNTWRFNPLDAAHRSLTNNTPLTLEQLSWPTDEQLLGEAGQTYRYSAQLFVTELLRLKNGRECLRKMVDELGQCYNWQTAFFHAFNEHFTRQLDLEKWWALQVIHFTGRDAEQLWTMGESWRQMDQALHSAVEIREATSQLSSQSAVSLQYVIRLWDPQQQLSLLKNKLRDLEMARARTSPELVPLLDEYRQAISTYLQSREGFSMTRWMTRVGPNKLPPAARDAIKQLDALDAKRLKLQPKESLPVPQELSVRN